MTRSVPVSTPGATTQTSPTHTGMSDSQVRCHVVFTGGWGSEDGGGGELVYIYNITDNPDLIFCTFCLVMKMMMFMITRVITYLENDLSSNSNQGYGKEYDVNNVLIADA